MKGIYITLITIMSVLAIALVCLLGYAIDNGGEFMAFGPVERVEKNIRKEETISIENIENLEINFVSSDAYIYTTNEQEIRVIQYANKTLKEDRLFQINKKNQTLTIEDEKEKIHFGLFINTNMVFEIFIPKDYCEKTNIKTVSGDIVMEDSICGKLDLKSTSGDIKNTSTLEADTNIETVSGDVDLENIVGNTTIKTTSGDVKANTIKGNTNIHTISGDIRLYSFIGGIDINTTSGDIKISHVELQRDSKMKTISGDVHLGLENTNCEIRTNTTSGAVRLPNGSSLVGTSPEHVLEIKTTSGDIAIDNH